MSTSVTLVLAGSSGIFYSDGGPEATVWSWTKDLLCARAPHIAWRVAVEPLGPGRALPDRVLAAAREHAPDVFVLSLASTPFAREFVRNRIRRRWPALYSAACVADGWLKRLAGGDVGTDAGTRRLVYGMPYSLALRTIGGEAMMAVEHAKENMIEALRALSRLEQTAVICRLPSGTSAAGRARERRYQQLERYVNRALIDVCDTHHFPYFHVLDAYAAATGRRPGRARDGVHLDAAVRRFEATLTADSVLESLGLGASESHSSLPRS